MKIADNSPMGEKLSFAYTKTNTIICSHYKDGVWGPIESRRDDNITISALSGSLHYGIQAFEGLKAYRGSDGSIRIFRPWENGARLKRSADFLGIASPDIDMFIEACKRVVIENEEFLPSYESRGTLYIRPFVIGVSPQIDLVSSTEVLFIVAAMPVGSFAGSINKPVKVLLARDHDRAAPLGTGSYKIGGNYAASLVAGMKAKQEGYASLLYLDSATKSSVDEFSSANFFAIKGNSYITPESDSILPSITNKSLMQLASDLGLTIEKRVVKESELSTFDEMGACGTAIVIMSVSEICDPLNNIVYKSLCGSNIAPLSMKLYKRLTGIQFGEESDIYNWSLVI